MQSFLIGAFLGAPWVLAFAPLSWWWVGLFSVTALPFVVQRLRFPGWAAWAFGWAAYGVGLSWLHTSLHTYGGLPAWFAWVAVGLFSAYLALFPVLALWCYRRFSSQNSAFNAVVLNALLWASLWTFLEWARGTFMTGFAWLSLGDALVDSPFANLLPWLGSYGTLLVVMLLSHLLVSACLVRKTSIVATFLVTATSVVIVLCLPVHTQSTGVLPVVGVQTNVDQSIKFDPDLVLSNMQKVFTLGDVAKQKIQPTGGILVFPETVNPLVWADTPIEWRVRFRDFATPNHTQVIFGSAIQEDQRYYNSIVALDGTEKAQNLELPKKRHDKRHLVPFGEFIPMGFRWFVSMLNMPMGEFTSASSPLVPFVFQGNALASTVCYEDIFSGEFARAIAQSRQEPTVLINLSNLAWFGQSWALDQHAQMGRTRSAEHRKPGLRVTNTGLSGVIDAQGRWAKQVAPGQTLVWTSSLEGRLGQTFFAKWGEQVWFLLWGAVLLLLCIRQGLLKAYNRVH